MSSAKNDLMYASDAILNKRFSFYNKKNLKGHEPQILHKLSQANDCSSEKNNLWLSSKGYKMSFFGTKA